MVHIIDEGSIFDAPIEKIWDYLPSERHLHPSVKSLNREVNGNVVTLSSERTINGKLTKVKIRNTLYRPIGMVQEHLEGPFAGSRAFIYYTPKGNKTAITIVGDFQMGGADEQTTRNALMAMWQMSFDEDNANLKMK